MIFNKPKRLVKECFLHCSASDNPKHDDVSIIDSWHRANGWNGIGYHYFIKGNGLVQAGRSLETTPAAQAGHNTGTIAICLHGLANFTQAQHASLKDLCEQINESYGGKIRFRGHKEIDPNRTCPVYDYKKILDLDDEGYMDL